MPNKHKLSQWHDGSVKPVHVGVYERDFGGPAWYSKWDGEYWLDGSESIKRASISRRKSNFMNERWRGLVK